MAQMPAATDTPDDLVEEIGQAYKSARNHSARWREKAKEDYAFVAGDQYSEEEKAALQEQLRPVIVFNRVGPVIDAVAGSEVSNRQEVRFLPRTLGATGVNELYTSAAKWVRDECDAEDEESDAFIDVSVCGMGWTETRMDYESDPDGEVRIDRIDPLEMYWDPAAQKRNLDDARWVLRVRKMAREDVQSMFPDADLDDVSGGSWSDAEEDDADGDPHDADRARFYEKDATSSVEQGRGKITVVQYQKWVREAYHLMLDPTTGQAAEIPADRFAKLAGRLQKLGMPVKAVRKTKRCYYQAFVAGKTVLGYGKAPCPDDFSLKCITGKRDRNHNTWYGLVRPMKDPQRWANKWLSQTMHIFNANAKGGLMAEKDAFENPREAEQRWADPTAITWLNPGALKNGQIQPKQPAQLPPTTMQLTEFAVSSVRDVTGVNLEMLGLADRQQAGVLEYQRKQAGLTILATLFDSLRRYRKEQGRVLLYFIQEYISDGRLIRITGGEGQQYVPLVRDPNTVRYDVIVDEAPSSPNQKERVFQILMQIMPALMKTGVPIPPDVLDYTPLPESLVQKWKQQIQQQMQAHAQQPPDPRMVKAQGELAIQSGKLQIERARAMADVENTRSMALVNLVKAGATQAGAQMDAANALVDAISGLQQQAHGQALDRASLAHDQMMDRAQLAHQQDMAQQQQDLRAQQANQQNQLAQQQAQQAD